MQIILNFVFSSTKNVIFLGFFMDFLPSNLTHFPWDLLFLSRISFWTSESIISLVILILFSRFSWKYSSFIWFVCIFSLYRDFKVKIKLHSGSLVAWKKCSSNILKCAITGILKFMYFQSAELGSNSSYSTVVMFRTKKL